MIIIRSLFIAPILAALSSVPAISQERREIPAELTVGTPVDELDSKAIDQLLFAYKMAWGWQDTEALMALHSADTEWINAYARMFRGTKPLGTFLEERLFPQFDPEVSRQEVSNMKVISRRYVGEKGAVVHMFTDGDRGASWNENEELRRTHIHLVLEKRNENWLIVHTAIMDAR